MFPYPSGDGLHVGHAYNYAVMDSYCRWQRHKGIEVFQPFGFDAFGLPAENYARKHNRDPREVTYENIGKFKSQMKRMNTEYSDLLTTSDPSYYKWTQWLFTELYKRGLAYKKMGSVNYCPSCETVLANEQTRGTHDIHDDRKFCERCKTQIEKRELEQWYFKITDYKERLIKNLDWIDYPEKTKKQQRTWLENLNDWCISRQRKWGCPIPIDGEEDTLDTFVCSSFYYLRYLDPENDTELFAREKYKQVDLYVGGNEHATSHLIYSRFIHMFLYDIGVVPCEEPFRSVRHQGMITYKGEKMSKSKGNVVNPDAYNPGHLRMYLMFIAHYFDGGSWSDEAFKGIERFDNRIKTWISKVSDEGEDIDLNEFIQKIDYNFEAFKTNKIISEWMIFYNQNKNKILSNKTAYEIMKMYNIINPGSF